MIDGDGKSLTDSDTAILTDDLEDTVDGADVAQEGVTETGTCAGASGETGNIDTCEESRNLTLGLVLFGQPQEALIGNRHSCLFWFDGSIWEVCTLAKIALCDDVEERRFADVGQADDTHLQVVGWATELCPFDGSGLLGRHG